MPTSLERADAGIVPHKSASTLGADTAGALAGVAYFSAIFVYISFLIGSVTALVALSAKFEKISAPLASEVS